MTKKNGSDTINSYPKENESRGGKMKLDLKRLKAERIANGLSQADMAKKMGWKDRAVYAKRENGIVSIGVDEFIKMAEILGYNKNEVGIFFKEDVLERER